MNIPIETKPALWGLAGGALALAVIGFTWGGWITAGTAEVSVRGKVVGKLGPDDFFGDTYQYTATFDLPVTAVKPPAAEPLKGTPLPAGGGEPAKAYAAFSKAVAAGDMAAIRRGAAAERAKQMDAPEFKEMLPMIQAMQPKNVKITGGSMDGNTATLLATAKDGKETSTGTITMVREGGAWKVEKESWKTKSE